MTTRLKSHYNLLESRWMELTSRDGSGDARARSGNRGKAIL
jgi:hypothetical protein